MIRSKVKCQICRELFSLSNIKRHEKSCDYNLKNKKRSIFTGYCKYCNKLCKNLNSQSQHELYCTKNPNKSAYERLKIIRTKKIHYNNQYTKVKNDGSVYKCSKETKEKLSFKGLGRKLSKEIKENLSTKRSMFLEEVGAGGFRWIKYYEIENILGKKYIVRGTWELKFGSYLNSKNILWERKHYLKYINNNIIKTYCPDFYLPTTKEYIEVKGYYSDQDKNKIKLVEDQNKLTIKILLYDDLKSLGVL